MLQKLVLIIALDREKHFGRAAESCGVAQPTLSQAIQQLEEHFDVKLVNRSSRFLGFTPEGEKLLTWARRLVGDVEAMEQDIRGLRSGVGAQVRIAAVPSAIRATTAIANTFRLSNPAIRLSVLMRTSEELLALLRNREIDLGITYIDNEPIEEVETVSLYREQYSLLTTEDGPAGKMSTITWREVGNLPLCLFTRKFQQRRIMDRIFQSARIDVKPVIETDSVLGLTLNVAEGSLAGIVATELIATMKFSDHIRVISIENSAVSYTIGLVIPKNYPISSAAQRLIDIAKASQVQTGSDQSQIDWVRQ